MKKSEKYIKIDKKSIRKKNNNSVFYDLKFLKIHI